MKKIIGMKKKIIGDDVGDDEGGSAFIHDISV